MGRLQVEENQADSYSLSQVPASSCCQKQNPGVVAVRLLLLKHRCCHEERRHEWEKGREWCSGRVLWMGTMETVVRSGKKEKLEEALME